MDRRNFTKRTVLLFFSIKVFPEFVFAIEKEGVDNILLPNWYISDRVQGHIRLPLKTLKENPLFFRKANLVLKKMGINVITRHFKTSNEGAWWNSKYGKIEVNNIDKNLAEKIIKDAHNLNMHIIAYYRHMEDNYIAKNNPDWLCRNWKGKKIKTLTNRGYYICFNSPYKEYVKNRLVELTKLGIDGFYFDETHMPRTGCWCKYCKKTFEKTYKMKIPTKVDFKDIKWAKYYTEFNNKTVEKTFIEWKKSVKKINPNLIFIISLHLYPTFYDYHLSTNLMYISDSVKSEFDIPVKVPKDKKRSIFNPYNIYFNKEVKLALGYILIRDGAKNNPAHVWIPQAIDETTLKYSTAGVITYGNIANINIIESLLLNKKSDFYNSIFDLNKILKNVFEKMIPEKKIAIYYSEKSRNYFIPNYGEAYNKVISPIETAYKLLFEKKLPCIFFTDETISQISIETEILFIPTLYGLSKSEKSIFEQYLKKGGTICLSINDLNKALKKFQFYFKFYSDKNIHISFFKSVDNKELYIFISNKIAWISDIKWRRRPKYIKKQLNYTVPSNINVKFIINSFVLKNKIYKIEELLGNKIKINSSMNKVLISNISSLSVVKIAML